MIIEGLSKQAPPIIRDVDAIEMGRNKIQKRVSNKWTPSRPHKLFQFPSVWTIREPVSRK